MSSNTGLDEGLTCGFFEDEVFFLLGKLSWENGFVANCGCGFLSFFCLLGKLGFSLGFLVKAVVGGFLVVVVVVVLGFLVVAVVLGFLVVVVVVGLGFLVVGRWIVGKSLFTGTVPCWDFPLLGCLLSSSGYLHHLVVTGLKSCACWVLAT